MKTTLIKKPEAAEILGVSVRTLEKMIARGALPAYRIGPKMVRLRREDIDDYLETHRAAPVLRKIEPVRPCRYVPGMKVV
jgi:excisionase family DNA binding protein